jgi:hypothetical protein
MLNPTTLPGSPPRQKTRPTLRKRRIPDALIYEMVNAQAIYYRGYRDVLQGKKQAEDLMGSSFLQSLIISRLIRFLLQCLPATYEVLTNEVGLQFSSKHWRAADIAVYRKAQLKNIPRHNKYLQIPPQIVFEIDTKADLKRFRTIMDYYYAKTDDLLDFGVEKVIWIFTDARKIMVAEPHASWLTVNWDQPIQVIAGVDVNLQELITTEEA